MTNEFQNGRARAEAVINQKMANAGLPSSNNASYDADFKAGQRDKKAGYYDKWYRYNRRDDGEAYDAGFKSVDFPKGKDITIIEENR